MTSPIQLVDFFSGCGGTSLGLQQAGFDVIAGVDLDPYAAATFRHNFPDATFLERDVRDLVPGDISPMLDRRPVAFAGCAPCQPFSIQNRQRDLGDPRRGLLAQFQRFVMELRPEYVIVENVAGAQRLDESGTFQEFMSALCALGYAVDAGVLRAGDFGVPQERRRLVILGALSVGVSLPTAPLGGARRDATVRQVIGHLPKLAAGEVDRADPDHAAMRLSPVNLERIRATPEGGGRNDWPPRLRLECHEGHSGHSDVYGRMRWDRPASGLTTRCLSYSNGRFGHPEQDRAISAREAACLQTFPESFRFMGPLTEKGRQIGNAVPPALARRIGAGIMATRG